MNETNYEGKEVEYDVSDTVRLPVGLEVDGQRYRDVVIEEMCGIDDHNMADKKIKKNPAKSLTVLLSRCVQAIEGLLPLKENPEKKFDRTFFRKMTIIDRDFLVSRIRMLSGKDEIMMAGVCPRCGDIWEEYTNLSKLEVVEWPEDKPLEIPFELTRGLRVKTDSGYEVYKEGIIKFPDGVIQEAIGELDNGAAIMDTMISSTIKKLGELDYVDTEQVKRMKSIDRQHLMQQLQMKLPGMRQWKLVNCDKCNRLFDITADISSFLDGSRTKIQNE